MSHNPEFGYFLVRYFVGKEEWVCQKWTYNAALSFALSAMPATIENEKGEIIGG